MNQMINWNIYVNDDYAMTPGSPKPFYIRAVELFGQMDIDGRKVEKTPDYIRTPWYTPTMGKVWIVKLEIRKKPS
jgi:hypothetical protein